MANDKIPSPLDDKNSPPKQDPPKTPPVEGKSAAKVIGRSMSKVRQVMVDRFGSDVKMCVKNSSWQKNRFDPENVPHRHFFDSVARRTGKLNTHLTFMAGHTHAFSYEVDNDGNIKPSSFVCGPALIEKTTNSGDGRSEKKLLQAVIWKNEETNELKIDDHVHVMEYRKSESIDVKV